MPYDSSITDFDDSASKAMSLFELQTFIREVIQETLPASFWVRAEMSDVRVNSSSGHCYLEFIEKDEKSGQIIAKARATIWARTFQMLRPYFERETGQVFTSGLKVLVKVSVEFHEVYGYSLNVCDMDPSYTLGDLVKKRKEIIRRLQEEGIFDLNRELPFPVLPQRIAVITSPTAAGYEDFIRQLADNEYGLAFYIKLFPAVMQGEKTEESVIAALDRIFPHVNLFDVVVIIRGGGSTSELSCFDSYSLAANCAQFPLPVVTGIGHERDDTIVDSVAHTRLKTPTAVAAFLIERMTREAALIQEFEQAVCEEATKNLLRKKTVLQTLTVRLPVTVSGHIEQHRKQLNRVTAFMSTLPQWILLRSEKLNEIPPRLQRAADAMILNHSARIAEMPIRLLRAYQTACSKRQQTLELNEQYIKMVSPEYVLKRGYTLTYMNNKIVKYAEELSAGDKITVKFTDGEKKGKIL